jgi:NAD(P)-dependent dehydrogenase (short-subunit alcohol dehydrogenase family)
MAGRVTGKVAFVTSGGRGQGRSHAIRLTEESAEARHTTGLQFTVDARNTIR